VPFDQLSKALSFYDWQVPNQALSFIFLELPGRRVGEWGQWLFGVARHLP